MSSSAEYQSDRSGGKGFFILVWKRRGGRHFSGGLSDSSRRHVIYALSYLLRSPQLRSAMRRSGSQPTSYNIELNISSPPSRVRAVNHPPRGDLREFVI